MVGADTRLTDPLTKEVKDIGHKIRRAEPFLCGISGSYGPAYQGIMYLREQIKERLNSVGTKMPIFVAAELITEFADTNFPEEEDGFQLLLAGFETLENGKETGVLAIASRAGHFFVGVSPTLNKVEDKVLCVSESDEAEEASLECLKKHYCWEDLLEERTKAQLDAVSNRALHLIREAIALAFSHPYTGGNIEVFRFSRGEMFAKKLKKFITISAKVNRHQGMAEWKARDEKDREAKEVLDDDEEVDAEALDNQSLPEVEGKEESRRKKKKKYHKNNKKKKHKRNS